MFVSNNICKIIWNAGLKLAVLAMLFLASSFSLRAQTSDVLRVECSGNVFECRFFFPFDSAVFQTSYMDNAKTVAKLDSLLGVYGVSKVENLKVIAYSSPEGVYQYNVNLSARRAESLRNFIASKYPALAGKVTLSPGDESWDTLRAMIENDIRLGNASRSKMLEIIDSNDAPDVKERKLSAMPIYKYLYSNYFKKLRYAAIRLMIFGDAMQNVEDQQVVAAVYFKKDETDIDPDYMGNGANIESIRNLIGEDASNIDNITIYGHTSPDGSAAKSNSTSIERAKALAEAIEKDYPELKGRINVVSEGEDWFRLREQVASVKSISEEARQSALSIIDSNVSSETKMEQLKAQPELKDILEDIFSQLRRADLSINKKSAKPAAETTGTQAKAKTSVETVPAVYYKKSETKIDPEYMGNATTIDDIRSLIGDDTTNIETITIYGHTSPDGPTDKNIRFSTKRAKSLAQIIEKEYPELKGRVKIETSGEDWDGFRELILASDGFDDEARERLLVIIDSNDTPEVKKAKLKKQPEFDFIAEDILPKLRRATYSVDYKPAEPSIVPELTFDEEIPDEPLYTKKIKNVLPKLDTSTPAMEYRHLPLFAASTNLLFDLAITPNFSLELPIGKEWSIYGDYTFPWWVNKANDRAWQILKWDLGVRHWFSKHNVADPMDILNGHFAALEFSAGYYDIEPKHKGNQGEFQSFSFQYGYAWNLSQFWRLEAFAGIGWLGTHYRHYEGNVGDTKLLYKYSAKTQWFGPTDAGISVKYIFTRVPGRRIEK